MNYVNEQNMQEILDGIARKIGQGGGSGAGLEDWQSEHTYSENDIFVYSGQIYRAIVDFESDTTFSVIQILEEYTLQGGETPIAYAKGTDIVVDDIVSYDSNYYKALYDFTCGEEFGLYAFEQYVPQELTEVQEAEIINHFLPNIYSGGNMSIEDSTPIGTIISFMGTIAPENYLVCDGTIYNIADYIELAEFIKTQFGSYNYFGGDGITTFAVPDLQGEFLRMTGTNSHANQGDGANVGVHQDGTEISYVFNDGMGNVVGLGRINGSTEEEARSNGELRNPDSRISYHTSTLRWQLLSQENTSATNNTSHFTSRPTNTSVLYCIKYKMSITNAEEIKDLTTEDIKQIVSAYNPVFEEAKGIEYSTEERRIGTWIDGKPLYQKTLSLTTPSTSAETMIADITSLNIDRVISIDGILGDDIYWPINIYVNDELYSDVYYEFGKLYMRTYANYNSSLYITLQYTKTTD